MDPVFFGLQSDLLLSELHLNGNNSHQVACAFHPVAHPEPILHEMIEPVSYPHLPSEPEHDGGYSSNHVTHSSSSQGSGMHHGSDNGDRDRERGGGGGGSGGGGGDRHHHNHHEDKKAAATNTVTMGQLQKIPPPLAASAAAVLNSLNSIQPRSQVLGDKDSTRGKGKTKAQ